MLCYNSPADYHPSGTSDRQTLEVKFSTVGAIVHKWAAPIYRDKIIFVVVTTYIILIFNSKFGYLLFFVIIFLNFVFMMCEKIEELLNSSILCQLFDAGWYIQLRAYLFLYKNRRHIRAFWLCL